MPFPQELVVPAAGRRDGAKYTRAPGTSCLEVSGMPWGLLQPEWLLQPISNGRWDSSEGREGLEAGSRDADRLQVCAVSSFLRAYFRADNCCPWGKKKKDGLQHWTGMLRAATLCGSSSRRTHQNL